MPHQLLPFQIRSETHGLNIISCHSGPTCSLLLHFSLVILRHRFAESRSFRNRNQCADRVHSSPKFSLRSGWSTTKMPNGPQSQPWLSTKYIRCIRSNKHIYIHTHTHTQIYIQPFSMDWPRWYRISKTCLNYAKQRHFQTFHFQQPIFGIFQVNWTIFRKEEKKV